MFINDNALPIGKILLVIAIGVKIAIILSRIHGGS